MKVLLTRPKGKNQSMAVALEHHHIPYMITPLLKVLPVSQAEYHTPHPLTQVDTVIFVSPNAVKYADALYQQAWPTHLDYFAVGKATRNALLNLGIQSITPQSSQQTTEGLLALPELDAVKNKKILIVRGIGGRASLAQVLEQRQASVSYWEVYQRLPVDLNAKQITNQWKIAKIDTIIVTSGEILSNLIKLVPKELFSWLQTCHIIVPSARVEQLAFQHGLEHVTNAKAANSAAMISALIN
ncbi:uroporphyrinogen-III synthase [uncultured Shewanella sp.]|uniref:uroporphyrinogen-III synthase n=1 Tax=uncultured Shewanella sp. TaxID=173975 RepID=UPI00261AD50B|nr:uroporphyrinogen-III synthase [uncultured Shewanella sp.]